ALSIIWMCRCGKYCSAVDSTLGTRYAEMVSVTPIRRRPLSSLGAARMSWLAREPAYVTLRACDTNRSPVSVRRNPLACRTNSDTPSACSMARNATVTEDCDTLHRRAALETCPVSASARKYSNCRSVSCIFPALNIHVIYIASYIIYISNTSIDLLGYGP